MPPNDLYRPIGIDLRVLEDLFKGDRSRVHEWLRLYLEEAPKIFAQVKDAHGQGDGKALARAVHELRPQAHYLAVRTCWRCSWTSGSGAGQWVPMLAMQRWRNCWRWGKGWKPRSVQCSHRRETEAELVELRGPQPICTVELRTMIQLALADDQLLFRKGMSMLLRDMAERAGGARVRATVRNSCWD